VLGYLLYSSLFAGLAATCETEQELQMYMPLAAAPTWLSFALIWGDHQRLQLRLVIAASLFPPTAPIIMFLRMARRFRPSGSLASRSDCMVVSIWVSSGSPRASIASAS
jgi:ABC-2 type transport system permease protein